MHRTSVIACITSCEYGALAGGDLVHMHGLLEGFWLRGFGARTENPKPNLIRSSFAHRGKSLKPSNLRVNRIRKLLRSRGSELCFVIEMLMMHRLSVHDASSLCIFGAGAAERSFVVVLRVPEQELIQRFISSKCSTRPSRCSFCSIPC